MTNDSRFKTLKTGRRETERLSTLLTELQRAIRLLEESIASEEERARSRGRSHYRYPLMARLMAKRRDNLRGAIATLERRLTNRVQESISA